jgi:hypothetical protein
MAGTTRLELATSAVTVNAGMEYQQLTGYFQKHSVASRTVRNTYCSHNVPTRRVGKCTEIVMGGHGPKVLGSEGTGEQGVLENLAESPLPPPDTRSPARLVRKLPEPL